MLYAATSSAQTGIFTPDNGSLGMPGESAPIDTVQSPGLQDIGDTVPGDTLQTTHRIRQYNHRQQVVVGSVVMLCIGLAMVAMNNYNPRR